MVLVTEHGTICSISKKRLLDNQKKVKKYEYKPEEYALHNGKLNKAEKKKAKQCQVEKNTKVNTFIRSIAWREDSRTNIMAESEVTYIRLI